MIMEVLGEALVTISVQVAFWILLSLQLDHLLSVFIIILLLELDVFHMDHLIVGAVVLLLDLLIIILNIKNALLIHLILNRLLLLSFANSVLD